MKRALIITAMCLAVIAAKAQNATGRIVNESLKPIAYVNVVLLSADSTYINGVTTADDGTFSISYDQDSCLLKVSCVGYETRFLAVKEERMGDIVICHDSHILKEVVVEAARPAMKMTPGGMSFDIQKSLLSQAGTALDVLSELPRVNVTSSGAVYVFGKGSPLIYINGRPLKSDTELRQLTSKDIKSVEVITAPGARYSVSAVYTGGESVSVSSDDCQTAINGVTIDAQHPVDVYTVDGKLVMKNATSLSALKRGVYVVNGVKIVK